MKAVVSVSNASRTFGSRSEIVALDEVSLTIYERDFVAIEGPSGSGKSTLLNLMGALDYASSGEVKIGGTDTRMLSDAELADLRAASIGFVFQQHHLIHTMSAVENVASGLLYRGVPGRQRRARSAQALAQVGLHHKCAIKTSKLSGGEQQRVAIARALVDNPDLILADEPTGNLDSETSGQMMDLFRQLNDAGKTIVLITHDRNVAARADIRVRMCDGRIVSHNAN